MGWAHCGTDDAGRAIGYAIAATCDEPGCDAEIDRGLSYACGGMHGALEFACDQYFCDSHLVSLVQPSADSAQSQSICQQCTALLDESVWWERGDDGVFSPAG